MEVQVTEKPGGLTDGQWEAIQQIVRATGRIVDTVQEISSGDMDANTGRQVIAAYRKKVAKAEKDLVPAKDKGKEWTS